MIDHVSELYLRAGLLTMTLDEGNGDVESCGVDADTLDGARRVSCFGECVADLLAESCVGRKVDVFAPSDVVGVDEERLEFVR